MENSQGIYPIAKAVPLMDMVSEEDYPIAEAVPHHDMSEYETDEGIPLMVFPAIIGFWLAAGVVLTGGLYGTAVSVYCLAKKLGYKIL